MRILLKNRALIKISGRDSEQFLQNQLSNDIEKLDQNNIQINAYCQHQGKIIGLLWVMRMNDNLYLSFPDDLLDKIINRLKMFVVMSEVVIEDVTNVYSQIGLINDVSSYEYRINSDLAMILENPMSENDNLSDDLTIWSKALIDSGIPEIYCQTSEKFVPQMLNLDINEIGVNFSKGCYPGQEVVARLHYLGSAKRRLFAFQSDHEMQVGDSLYCSTSKTALARGDRYKGSGIVVSKVKSSTLFFCLATLDVDLIDEEITLNNENGLKLERINYE
jgi:tRNA-modifying protein YgfZ